MLDHSKDGAGQDEQPAAGPRRRGGWWFRGWTRAAFGLSRLRCSRGIPARAVLARAWILYLGVTVVVIAGYVGGPFRTPLVLNAVGVSSVVAILVGARRLAPASRLPWYWFAFGQAMFTAGDFLAYNYTSLFGGQLPTPSVADAVYLCVFPSLITGLVLLIRRRNPGRDRASVLDALIVTVGIGALSWVLLMAPVAKDDTLPLAGKLVTIFYPLGDLLLMGVVVRLAIGGGQRPATFHLLALGFAALLVSDSLYAYLQLHGLYNGTGNWLDGGWMLFYILLGAAALHPSTARVCEQDRDPDERLSRARLVLLATAILIAPVTLAVRGVLHDTRDELVLASASIVLSVLVLTRMAGIIHRREQDATREVTLRHAAEQLASVRTPEAMDAVVLDAARTVAGVACDARLYLVNAAGGGLTAVAATDVDPGALPVLDRAALPSSDGARVLIARRGEPSDHLSLASFAISAGMVCLAPILLRGEFHGALVLSGHSVPSASARHGLAALAAEVALALETVALTEDLASREARFSSLVQHASDVITVIDPDTTITYVSKSVRRVLGHSTERLLGTRFAELVHHDDLARTLPFLTDSASNLTDGSVEFRLQRADRTWATVETVRTDLLEDPSVAGIVLTSRDVGERKAFEAKLAHQAFHDALTGLPNRALFRNRVIQALARQRRRHDPLAVLFIDLDDFKAINDSHGHAAGDLLLREVGARLAACVRSVDTAARLGGDEFAILLEGNDPQFDGPSVAQRVLQALAAPLDLEGRSVFVHASIGIALNDDDCASPTAAQELLRNADVAMYVAKEHGKDCCELFVPGMQAESVTRLGLKDDLRQAINDDQFILHYQPIIDLTSDQMIGVEALVRWQHPTNGLVPPDQFIPLAEETGLIVPLGRRVLQLACQQAKRLQDAGPSTANLSMSVNVSGRQLASPSIVADVHDALRTSGIPPSTLIIELTESVMMGDTNVVIQRLHELHSLGVRLAVDDFGTGYASLNYIRNFPLDILKVDQSFIRDATNDGLALAAAIIDLAGLMNLCAVAEGIEDATQLERLRELKWVRLA